jgi:acyl transferase domain-containing protein
LIGADLREVIYPGPNGRQEAEERLEQTAFAQPALFVIQYAMAQMFLDLGFKPEALVGHSLGEITCATLSGVLSLEDALYLVAERGRLMQKMAPGSMLSVNRRNDFGCCHQWTQTVRAFRFSIISQPDTKRPRT